jgi:hypothetical protein
LLDLRSIFVDADHTLTGRGEACTRDEAYVSGAYDAKFHRELIARFRIPERCQGPGRKVPCGHGRESV